MLQQEQAQAQHNLISSLRGETQGDMASLMARYGSQLALAGGVAGSPITSPQTPIYATPIGALTGTAVPR
jgi:hypothetical protein